MDELNYTLSVPSTGETRELPHAQVLAELARGEITPDHWVWSPQHDDWKQIAEIPALSAIASAQQPVLAPIAIAPLPIPVAKEKAAKKEPRPDWKRKEDGDYGFPWTKAFLGALAIFVAILIVVNYFLIDRPISAALAGTPYVSVPTHAHLGSFIQPDALVIHTLHNHELNESNLADYFCTLAQNTPAGVIPGKPFQIVTFTSSWMSQYAMNAADWHRFGEMKDAAAEQRKTFLLDHLSSTSGHLLVRHLHGHSEESLQATRDQVWQGLLATFLGK